MKLNSASFCSAAEADIVVAGDARNDILSRPLVTYVADDVIVLVRVWIPLQLALALRTEELGDNLAHLGCHGLLHLELLLLTHLHHLLLLHLHLELSLLLILVHLLLLHLHLMLLALLHHLHLLLLHVHGVLRLHVVHLHVELLQDLLHLVRWGWLCVLNLLLIVWRLEIVLFGGLRAIRHLQRGLFTDFFGLGTFGKLFISWMPLALQVDVASTLSFVVNLPPVVHLAFSANEAR